jgi:hypothetical protein
MNQQKLTKEEEHKITTERFKKTPQEKEASKHAKSAWKKSQKHEQTKG